jgi:hypothetical protein
MIAIRGGQQSEFIFAICGNEKSSTEDKHGFGALRIDEDLREIPRAPAEAIAALIFFQVVPASLE